jgi:hypothetical protein
MSTGNLPGLRAFPGLPRPETRDKSKEEFYSVFTVINHQNTNLDCTVPSVRLGEAT